MNRKKFLRWLGLGAIAAPFVAVGAVKAITAPKAGRLDLYVDPSNRIGSAACMRLQHPWENPGEFWNAVRVAQTGGPVDSRLVERVPQDPFLLPRKNGKTNMLADFCEQHPKDFPLIFRNSKGDRVEFWLS